MNENESVIFEEAIDVSDIKEVESLEESEVSLLQNEIKLLKAELARRDELERTEARIASELAEFAEYFPETEICTIPDEIWEKVRAGASLSATYALYFRKNELQSKKIAQENEKNRRMSAGSVSSWGDERYYSPSEVKRMSPAQIRANYDDIISSMKHWN